MRMAENATSDLPEQATVRDQVLHSTKSLLKNQLRRRAISRPQVYARLYECSDVEGADFFNNLDRLPRFRFGGNRTSNTGKERDIEKKAAELRLRELTERLKKGPVPPPRTRHVPNRNNNQCSPAANSNVCDGGNSSRSVPLRSASFSQVDYSADDKKYVRRRCPLRETHLQSENSHARTILTLPRSKNSSNRPTSLHTANHRTQNTAVSPESHKAFHSKDVNDLCEMIYQGCKVEKDNQQEDIKVDDYVARNSVVDCANAPEQSQEKRRDKSRRRKGMYISQWPNTYQTSEEIVSQFPEETSFPSCENLPCDVPQLRISCEKSTDTCRVSQDEPQSPDFILVPPHWNDKLRNRPPLSAQSSEEKDNSSLKLNVKVNQLLRADSLSESEVEGNRGDAQGFVSSDVSDCEIRSAGYNESNDHIPRRYSKRPLRGPYGQMLEAEMKKPETGRKQYTNELKFLEDITRHGPTSLSCSSSVGSGDCKPNYVNRIRGSSNHSLDDTQLKNCLNSVSSGDKLQGVNKRKISTDSLGLRDTRNEGEQRFFVSHQRTTSSPSNLEGLSHSEVSPELLEHLLRGSSEHLATVENLQRNNVSFVYLYFGFVRLFVIVS